MSRFQTRCDRMRWIVLYTYSVERAYAWGQGAIIHKREDISSIPDARPTPEFVWLVK